MKEHSRVSPPWKAIILSALLGYILAICTLQSPTGSYVVSPSHNQAQFGVIPQRILMSTGEIPDHDISDSVDRMLEEDEAEEEKAPVLDSSISTIVLLLIALTLAFEYGKESIEESADRNMEPIIQGLFGELTVLGFLSMVTFCVTKMGLFDELGAYLFGEGEGEELLEIFESVHFMLFFIMVFFVINVLVLMRGSKLQSYKWYVLCFMAITCFCSLMMTCRLLIFYWFLGGYSTVPVSTKNT